MLAQAIIGAVVLAVAFYMLTPKVSTRIRKSRYWALGWGAYLTLLSLAGKLLLPVVDQYDHFSDDQVIPVLFVLSILFVLATLLWTVYPKRRKSC